MCVSCKFFQVDDSSHGTDFEFTSHRPWAACIWAFIIAVSYRMGLTTSSCVYSTCSRTTTRRSRATEVDPLPSLPLAYFFRGVWASSYHDLSHYKVAIALQCFTRCHRHPSDWTPIARSDAGRLDLMQEPRAKAEGFESPSR